MRIILMLFLLQLNLTALGQVHFADTTDNENIIRNFQHAYYSQELGFLVPEDFTPELYDVLVKWIGTPYRYAGNSEKGIDCSGFVSKIYNDYYQKNLGARNSGEIYSKMEKLDIEDLTEGDLVFFRIYKRRISHVGIYLGNEKFIHSSTSRGVIVSDLNENYYKRSFAGAGRIRNSVNINNLSQHDQ